MHLKHKIHVLKKDKFLTDPHKSLKNQKYKKVFEGVEKTMRESIGSRPLGGIRNRKYDERIDLTRTNTTVDSG